MKPIPSDAELLFVETVATGTVHIAVRYVRSSNATT